MKIYERVYDNQFNDDLTEKENKLLGDFEIVDGNMDDYSYECIVKSNENGELYILIGQEVSGFYHLNQGGTKNTIEKLSDNRFVRAYIEHNNQLTP